MTSRILLFTAVAAIASALSFTACSGKSASEHSGASAAAGPGGPQLGKPGGGPGIDKSADTLLQSMIREIVPRFKVCSYHDPETGIDMAYNLYEPEVADGVRCPLVLFIADAGTPGRDVSLPLTQGYGALVWATPEWQRAHPCYVLVPQFSGVAVNDAYERTPEVDVVVRLVRDLAANKNVDAKRLYTTGQSMGGMISMYYNVAYPDLFAASIFVDSHWDTSTFPELARHRFVYFIAGDKGKSYPEIAPLEEACRADSVDYTFAEWSARLPWATQDSVAATMLDKGAPVNIFQFTPGSVLPASGKGSEHLYSFDYAYRNSAVRSWLFRQHN